MATGTLRAALILGLLSCVGPFSIDLYLPAMPLIGHALGAGVAETQMTVTAYFIAFGVAQLVYGPWSDSVGRKAPLYLGLAVFLAGSAACAMAPDIGALVIGRFVQGLGGAAVMVIPRAIIRDMHTGPAATRLMATVMLVISVSPMLAPLAGSGLMALFGWREIFWALVAVGIVSLAITGFALPETLSHAERRPVDLGALTRGTARLLMDRTFMGLTLLGGFGMASFFVFLASASFVYTESFGLSPTGFSLAFALNAIGFFTSSQFAARLGERYGAPTVIRRATLGFATFTIGLLVVVAMGGGALPVIMAGLFCANACLGLVIPTTMVMALDEHGDIAGLASSLGGTLQMLAGGVMIAATGPFFDSTALPMVAAIALCGLIALTLSAAVLRPAAATGA
ncbi:multidrug effflux MFS transporter [Acidimangrovimonas sediminis]|uniref:multidrug effflux MFS transporter n=1 Tax=Acidimangrovimonas sediminis TaxID=2056283 RepID=UPI000C7FDD2E|nr:multidrug effflux MFS transporter [Acidimangrovimonas sediminis]